MPYWTIAAGTTRVVQAKGDIGDFITILAVDEHPLLTLFPRRKVKDHNPGVLEDTLAAVDNSNYHSQHASAPAAVDTNRTLVENETQRMMKTASVTRAQQAVAQYGMGRELEYQMIKKSRELLRDAEATLVSDQAMQAPTPANARTGKMAGIGAIITTGVDTNALTQARFDTNMATVVALGGAPTRVFMDATYRAAANAWTTVHTRFSPKIQHLEQEVMTYHSDFGPTLSLEWHHLLPQDLVGNAPHCLAVAPALWEICEFRPLSRTSIPDTGSGPSTLMDWEWCVLCKAEKGNWSTEV